MRQVFFNVLGLSLPEYDQSTLPESVALDSKHNLLELFEKFVAENGTQGVEA